HTRSYGDWSSDVCSSDLDVRLVVDVRVDELAVVHPVQMIAGENQIVVRVIPGEMAHRLADRVGGPLKPVRIVRRLLGGEDLHEEIGRASCRERSEGRGVS